MIASVASHAPATCERGTELAIKILLFQYFFNIFEGAPARIRIWLRACTVLVIQIPATARTQSLALVAANHLDRHRQQYLLAQNVFQQQPVALVIADIGFGLRDRQFVPAGVSALRPIQQVKGLCDIANDYLEAARAIQFQAGGEITNQPDVQQDFVLAVTLFDQLGATLAADGGTSPHIGAEINGIGPELLVELDLVEFQFLETDKHLDPHAPTHPLAGPREHPE